MQALTIMTTTTSKAQAQKIAKALLNERLAACVQVLGPLESLYHWQGKVETASEWLCLIKTREEFFEQVASSIRANHTYQTPEIIALPITAGDKDYLEWLARETTPREALR